MRFKGITEYAIRALLYLSRFDRCVPKSEICHAMRIPWGYFDTMSRLMIKAGIMQSVQGPFGGYALAKPAKDISLSDIYTVYEGAYTPDRCVMCKTKCIRAQDELCPLQKALHTIGRLTQDALAKITIQDLLEQGQADYPDSCGALMESVDLEAN